MTERMQAFEVVRTPKIKDSENKYVKRGEIATLTQPLAEHYHKLGYIRVTMDRLFDDEPDDRTNGTAVTEEADDEPSVDEPAAAPRELDKSEASEDAKSDTGTSETEVSSGRLSNRRRKRASS